MAIPKYDFKKIEAKWQKAWGKKGTYEPSLKKAKTPFYNLMMFPYPSAEGLHVGNMYAFVGSDIFGRFKRMQGNDVFEPIGLDGFGIHSENYAMKVGTHPVKQAKVSEKRFYKQLEMIGNGFAWKEHLETYDPEYYKWTQWVFIQLFKNGLAYRKKQAVNWCPSCKTVLADEQVIAGKCERCNSVVEKKELEQWFFKITEYADTLLSNLEKMDWSEKVKIAQKNWIGKSEGAELEFAIKGSDKKIKVFTTRPDTLFGATYMVLSPEHKLIEEFEEKLENAKEVKHYASSAKKRTEAERIENKDKTGIELRGIKAVNPITKKEIPIWVSDYVLTGYGTGAIMAVPAHDERDAEFAKKFGLPIKEVIVPNIVDRRNPPVKGKKIVERRNVHAIVRDPKTNKYLALKWKKYDWITFPMGGIEEGEDVVEAAKREVKEETGFLNLKLVRVLDGQARAEYFARHKDENRVSYTTAVVFDLTDHEKQEISEEDKDSFEIIWLDKSRLNYDNMTHAEIDLWSEKMNSENPVFTGVGVLMNSGQFDGMSSERAKTEITKAAEGRKKIQFRLRDWLISRQRYWGAPIPMIYCEKCDWQPVPEKDLPVKLPMIKDFRPKGTGQSPLANVKSFYETKCPNCKGKARRETDVSDTFLDSAWYYLRYPSANDKKKPWDAGIIKKWLPVNMYIGGAEHSVLHLLYVRFLTMALHDMGLLPFEEPVKKFRAHGLLIKEGAKMSKSKGNVVNPDEYIKNFGADTLRMYLMFLAPFEQGGDFRDAGILGVSRFLERVWKLAHTATFVDRNFKENDIDKKLHQTIKKVTEDIENLRYNTAISALMILLNELEKHDKIQKSVFENFLSMIAPFAPHVTEELWSKLKNKKSIHIHPWPKFDPKLIVEDNFTLVIQVNGKVRDTVELQRGLSEDEVKDIALQRDKVKQALQNSEPRAIIYVQDRLINIVI